MRSAVLVLALLVSSITTPRAVEAQQPEKLYRIGMLERTSPAVNAANVDGFRQGLRDLGYIEGKTFVIEYRSSDGRDERYPALAAELLQLKVDLIVTRGTPAALAAKQATATIPVVITGTGDPVAQGVVASLARPGANVTGLSAQVTDIYAKRVQILKEMLPRALRLPAMYASMEFTGGLIVYGVNYPDHYRRAASFVDRIFKGAAPASPRPDRPDIASRTIGSGAPVTRLRWVAFLLLVAAPLAAAGQPQDKVARIGMLRSEHRPLDDRIKQNIADVRAGLQDEGYVEGRHYRIEYYAPTSDVDVVTLARTLVRERVDVIHAIAHPAIDAVHRATTTIPIVAHDYETDPIAAGFVATLAKPGGNVTGMFLDLPEISGKLLELLKTALPGLRRIGVLWDPLTGRAHVIAIERAAKALGIEITIFEARPGSLERMVRAAADRKEGALLLLGSPLVSTEFPKIAEATTAARLPTIALFPAFARLGGLMAYGPDAPDQYRQEGRMIAKILKGTKPADLPIERPTKFYFLINRKTARAIGLPIPPSLLLQADQIIE